MKRRVRPLCNSHTARSSRARSNLVKRLSVLPSMSQAVRPALESPKRLEKRTKRRLPLRAGGYFDQSISALVSAC